MIYEINQDLTEAPVDIILHCCNTHCTMGSGVAKTIREKFPESYEVDCTTKKGDIDKLGKITVAKITNPHNQIKWVFNLYGQHTFGSKPREVNYEAIYNALDESRKRITNKTWKVGIPRLMGCVRAGGDWRIIRAMIDVIFEKSFFDVYICNYDGKLTNPNLKP